ncbi:MAG: LysE family transporter [Candidatus Pacebacteria bacterium]|nr:LysE family transporter [Candidatus Paceibacterota bacterium]
MKKTLLVIKKGLFLGLIIQLAIGPIFFFIVNLSLQKTLLDGLMGVLAATVVTYIYIALSVFGIGKILEEEKFKKIFGMISSIVLIIFGGIIINGAINSGDIEIAVNTSNLFASFTSVFLLAISNPLSIVFFTSLFSAKAIEHNYTKNELYFFGFGTGLSTFIFMGGAILLVSFLKEAIPIIVMQILNIAVGVLIIGYGTIILKLTKRKNRLEK